LRDAVYANLYAGNQTLARLRGSMAGTITVPYFPRNVGGFPLVPGETILMQIDHLALLKQMVIDNWSYKWPTNQMTLTVSRNPLRGFGSQIVKGVRRTEQLIATAGNYYDLGWWRTDGTGSHRWRHNKGVIPKKVSVQVAQNSAQVDALGRPIPTDGTVVAMGQGLSFSPADGQWAGYITTELTEQYITLRYSINLTYDDGNACGWLLDGSCILRVIVEG